MHRNNRKAKYYFLLYKGDSCSKSVEDLDRVLATLSPRQKRIHIIDNIKIRVEGFGKKQYEHAWTRDGRDVPLDELLTHLKKIIDNEDPTKIPTAPPTNMPQRWKLPKLGQIIVKVEEIDLAAEDDNEELIQTSNEMFEIDKESGRTSVLQAMQPKVVPSLFDLKDNRRKIEYLFTFDVGEEKGELVWCSGYIVDVSDGIKSKTSRWFSGKTTNSKVYEKGLAAKVDWDAVGGHEEESSIVPFMRGNFNKNRQGAWRLYFE